MAMLPELIRSIKDLETAVNELGERAELQQGIINATVLRTKRTVRGLLVIMVVVLGLLVVVASLLYYGQRRDDRIEMIQDRTSNGVLCPLYQIFVDSLNNPPPPNQTDDEARTREDAKIVILDGYAKLNCTES